MSGSSGRLLFTEEEKLCLQELVIKYKLNSTNTLMGNPNAKKMSWFRLTEEYNSIETNTKRNEKQLKKLWDNMKVRKKAILSMEKRQRMQTGGGSYPTETVTSADAGLIDEALLESTDVELQFVIDSDSVVNQSSADHSISILAMQPMVANVEPATQAEPVTRVAAGAVPPVQISPVDPATQSEPATQAAATNRNQLIQNEYEIRKMTYTKKEGREEEIHKLKIQELEYKVKAAEELYKKNRVERELAELQLKIAKEAHEFNNPNNT